MSSTTDATDKAAPLEVLRPVLGDRFVMTRGQLAACIWFAVFFMYLNYIPLFHSDIWCHVHYGSWMIEHGELVSEDPFLPLAEGMRVVNNAWLSQLLFAGVERLGGPQAMANVFAVVVLATYLIYSRVFYLLSGRLWIAVAGMLLLLATAWTRHAIIRPEIFGGLFLAILFWILMRVEPWRSRTIVWAQDQPEPQPFPIWLWFAAPLLFALWANMHGSFAVGLMVMGCHAAGVVFHSALEHREFGKVTQDPHVRRWIWLTELTILATLANPYGLDLLIETARFGRNENLRDVMEWLPLKLIDFEGLQFLGALFVSFFVIRHSRGRFHAAEVMLMFALIVLMASTVRMIGWLAPIWTISMLPHLTSLWKRVEPQFRSLIEQMTREESSAEAEPADEEDEEEEMAPLFKFPPHTYTIFACLTVWCAFALSPISQSLLSSKPRELSNIVSKGTPLGVTEYLNENPPETMVWAPQWWGDWLMWSGPDSLRVFMTTTLHLAPSTVWKDYMRVAEASSGWERTLTKYNVQTIVMDKDLQPVMHRAVRRSARWTKVYEDPRGVVYRLGAPNVASGDESADDKEDPAGVSTAKNTSSGADSSKTEKDEEVRR